MKKFSKRTQKGSLSCKAFLILCGLLCAGSVIAAGEYDSAGSFDNDHLIRIEYREPGSVTGAANELSPVSVTGSGNTRISTYGDSVIQVVIHEIDRGCYTEINGEIESLKAGNSCVTIKVAFTLNGKNWKWHHGLDRSEQMDKGMFYTDTVVIRTTIPPDGAFNGKDLAGGGYGEAVGMGTMSYYPLCAVSSETGGEGLGVDMSLPVVYRLAGNIDEGLIAEFDLATSPLTVKFPGRAFFRLVRFAYDPEWGMRSALEVFYKIYDEAFKKRVLKEGIWLPFTALRSIPGWGDFGFAYHETSWGSSDIKAGKKIPSILSDRGTGVASFQYTEPWDVQIPIKSNNIPYDTLVSENMIPEKHLEYLKISAINDKNGFWQARRLKTPWFRTGWAASITTNCDPELPGFNRYQFVLEEEINPARKMNVDGIYFDSMEWNWHHDLNYREDHFRYADYPLTFSKSTVKPAIWHFSSEFEFMKKIADEMHGQGKLAMGNGHGWNPFAAANLDLFGAELSWYSSYDHSAEALDFKRAISYRKPIVFLLNEGLNDKAFTESPYRGYKVYFEKMMAYGFFPSFFSVDASSDPYWQDKKKIENGRPYFKKYIPIIKEIAEAGWEPVTAAVTSDRRIRLERFGHGERLFFTVRNNGEDDAVCYVRMDFMKLGIKGRFKALEIVEGMFLKTEGESFVVKIPGGSTRVVRITTI